MELPRPAPPQLFKNNKAFRSKIEDLNDAITETDKRIEEIQNEQEIISKLNTMLEEPKFEFQDAFVLSREQSPETVPPTSNQNASDLASIDIFSLRIETHKLKLVFNFIRKKHDLQKRQINYAHQIYEKQLMKTVFHKFKLDNSILTNLKHKLNTIEQHNIIAFWRMHTRAVQFNKQVQKDLKVYILQTIKMETLIGKLRSKHNQLKCQEILTFWRHKLTKVNQLESKLIEVNSLVNLARLHAFLLVANDKQTNFNLMNSTASLINKRRTFETLNQSIIYHQMCKLAFDFNHQITNEKLSEILNLWHLKTIEIKTNFNSITNRFLIKRIFRKWRQKYPKMDFSDELVKFVGMQCLKLRYNSISDMQEVAEMQHELILKENMKIHLRKWMKMQRRLVNMHSTADQMHNSKVRSLVFKLWNSQIKREPLKLTPKLRSRTPRLQVYESPRRSPNRVEVSTPTRNRGWGGDIGTRTQARTE